MKFFAVLAFASASSAAAVVAALNPQDLGRLEVSLPCFRARHMLEFECLAVAPTFFVYNVQLLMADGRILKCSCSVH